MALEVETGGTRVAADERPALPARVAAVVVVPLARPLKVGMQLVPLYAPARPARRLEQVLDLGHQSVALQPRHQLGRTRHCLEMMEDFERITGDE